MHFLPLSLLLTFSAHNFSAPITTIFLENIPNYTSIVQSKTQYLTSFAQFKPSFENTFENKNKIQIFEAKKKSVKKKRNLQKSKKLNFTKENINKLSNFVPIYVKENSQFQLISSRIFNQILPNLEQDLQNNSDNLAVEPKGLNSKNEISNNFQTLENNENITDFQIELNLVEKADKQNEKENQVENQQEIKEIKEIKKENIEYENNEFWQINLAGNNNFDEYDSEENTEENDEKIVFGPIRKDLKIIELGKKTVKNNLNKILSKNQIKTKLIIPIPAPNPASETTQKLNQSLVLNTNQISNYTSNQTENSQNFQTFEPTNINLVEKNQDEIQESQALKEIKNSEKKIIPISVPKNNQNSAQNTDLTQMIIERCQKYNCDANKMLKVVKCESGGRNIAGTGGHIGPFQFTSRTFYSFATKYGVSNPDIWNMSDQVEVAAQMFAQNLGKQHWSCF